MIPAMAVGLLYDVHGNLTALEAVLADARDTPVSRWVLGGDYAAFGASPAEVVDRLQALPDAIWIRGNWDRWQDGDDADMPGEAPLLEARAAVAGALGPERVARLGALPATHSEDGTLFCHGAPADDMDSFLPRAREEDDELLNGVVERRIVFGHTHLAFAREHRGVTLVNPGSVGLPFDGDPRASWALLHGDGGIEHRRVQYDIDATCRALRERFGSPDWAQGAIRRLRVGRFDA